MKVLVAAAAFPPLSASRVGAALATAWAQRGAAVAVVPMAAAGAGLADVLAGLWRTEVEVVGTNLGPVSVVTGDSTALISVNLPAKQALDPAASSAYLGATVVELLTEITARHVALEVVGGEWHDGGRGFLDAFGGHREALEFWGERTLSLVVNASQARVELTGLRGMTSVEARDADGAMSLDMATLIHVDQTLADWAAVLGVDPSAPGSGAAGGVGAAVLSVAGQVVTGPQLIADLTDLETSLASCDLVVTGSSQLDFGSMGGEVLADLIERAQRHLVPLISVSGRNHISPRELRSIGVEAAYSVRDEADAGRELRAITTAEIRDAAQRVAHTWSW